jgi:hypothetical protein
MCVGLPVCVPTVNLELWSKIGSPFLEVWDKTTPPVHFALVILEMRSLELSPWLASNLNPPNLSLPSS